ncbi:MAG: DUF484 family protein [Pseudomonadales bacterium]
MSNNVTFEALQDHLKSHPEDLERLILGTEESTGVAISLPQRKFNLVSQKLSHAEAQIAEFIEVSRQNQTLFQLCHRLVETLQRPQSIQDVTSVLARLLQETLSHHHHHLFVFKDAPVEPCTSTTFIKASDFEGQVGGLFNPEKPVLGVIRQAESEVLFPDSGSQVASSALLPLQCEGLHGALAIGSESADGFHRDQDTLFIAFIGAFLAGLLAYRYFPAQTASEHASS